MSSNIHSWIDGHLALRQRAYETRGGIELEDGARWPRTTGADVVAIAALVDHPVRAHGTPGVLRRWRAALLDLQREALHAPHDTYALNRSFWSTLETVVVFLDDLAVTPPDPEIWDALLDELTTYRNVGPSGDGPIAHFDNIKTYDDLYNAQLKLLKEKRGTDSLDQPPGFSGGLRDIPRTTNADVLQLATYWATQLSDVKEVWGHDAVVARWTPVMADVDKLAKPGKADDTYTKNNEFWRELQQVAIHVAVSDEAPSKWSMVVDSVKDSIVHLPSTLSTAAAKTAEVIGDAAHGAGKVVGEVGKGLFSGIGAPVLIGAGLLGLFLISRGRGHESTEA